MMRQLGGEHHIRPPAARSRDHSSSVTPTVVADVVIVAVDFACVLVLVRVDLVPSLSKSRKESAFVLPNKVAIGHEHARPEVFSRIDLTDLKHAVCFGAVCESDETVDHDEAFVKHVPLAPSRSEHRGLSFA